MVAARRARARKGEIQSYGICTRVDVKEEEKEERAEERAEEEDKDISYHTNICTT